MSPSAAGGHPDVRGALAWLALRSLRNRGARLASRLKDPRYLLAFLAGLGYFGWIFGSMFLGDSESSEVARDVFVVPPWAEALAPLPLALLAVGWWTLGKYHTALAFDPAEVDFLFSAPATRRTLIRWKLAQKQVAVLITVLFALVYLLAAGAGRVGPLDLLLRGVGLWLLVTTIQLHQIASSLVRTAATQQGRAGLRHQWLPLAVFLVALLALGSALHAVLPAVRGAADVSRALMVVAEALEDPGARLVLLPLRWLLAPTFAREPLAWLLALPGAVAVLALHYLWVLRTDAGFEEGAAEAGRERAERRRALVKGGLAGFELSRMRSVPRPWFELRPAGHPAVALLWKNLAFAARLLRPSAGLLLGAVFVGSYFLMQAVGESPREAATIVAIMAFTLGGMTVAGGSIFIRNDLRMDLGKLDLLKTYPLRGRDVLAAELAASTVTLTVAQLFFLYVGLAFLLVAPPKLEPWWALGAGLVGVLLLLPPLNALLLGAQNALAVLFPAWTRVGANRPGGIEQMGMFMLTFLGTVLFLAVGLLAPAVFGAGVALRLVGPMGAWAALPAAAGAWLVLWGEVVLLVVLLGDAYDELDPADAGLLR